MGDVVFLIGAGASVDAGMPLVSRLTEELRDRLGIYGKHHAEFPEVFDAIAEHDPGIRSNYERFFEWLSFIDQAQMEPFNRLACFALDPRLLTAARKLRFFIKNPVWEILRSRHQLSTYQPAYLARLRDFLPEHGRLKVFTTNYDLCVEDACRAHGTDVITGFHPDTGQWTPSRFRNRGPGINLYKLHGSLNWNLGDDRVDWGNCPPVERYPPQWDQGPELVLGPGSKLQHDDPYVALYAEFHKAIRRAKVCVTIGCSFSDPHIKEPIRGASHRGTAIVDVNPSPVEWTCNRYTKIRKGAKEAFESDQILQAVQLIQRQK